MSRLSRDRREQYRGFNVLIYEEDYKQLCAWVLKKPNIETGGDLFGLWADKHTAVIQLVLGPGQGCSRTSVSFYQDVNYLERVGSYLTQNEGVCHIGEWHSHHQLGLAQPSGGDENTVWNNMPTYNLKRFVIFIANIRASGQHYNVNIGCFLFEIDDHGNQLAVLPGEFMILQKENPLSLKRKVSKERSKNAEMDNMTTITIKDLNLEVKGERNSRPSVTYLKPSTTPTKKRNREKKNQLQTEDQDANKADDDESCGDSKKQKMDTGASSPTTAGRSPGGRNTSSSGSFRISEDIQNLTINDEQLEPDEQPEVDMEEEEKKEQPEKKEEDTVEDDNDGKSLSAKNLNEPFNQKSKKEKSEGQEHKNEIENLEVKREARTSEGDQKKPNKKSGDKESPPQQLRPLPQLPNETGRQTLQVGGKAKTKADHSKESASQEERPLPELDKGTTPTEPNARGRQTLQVEEKAKKKDEKSEESATQEGRPLPELEQETTPTEQTGQQTLQVHEKAKTTANQSKGKAPQGGRPLPVPKEKTTPGGQTGQQTLQVKGKAKTKADQSKEKAPHGGRPLPKLEQETKPTGKTGQRGGATGQTMQVKEKAKPKTEQSKESTTKEGRSLRQPTQGKATSKSTVRPLQTEKKAVKKFVQQSSGKKAGSSGPGTKKRETPK